MCDERGTMRANTGEDTKSARRGVTQQAGGIESDEPGRERRLASLILVHRDRRPLMQVRDVYKMLYQAHLGVGHVIASPEQALRSLHEELARLADAPDACEEEPLWESISPEDTVGRLNLRPFKRLGLEAETLSRALVAFAERPPGDWRDLARSWAVVGRLVRDGVLPFGRASFRGFTSYVMREHYPAVHHSRQYRTAYRPAYRVLSAEICRSFFKGEIVVGPCRWQSVSSKGIFGGSIYESEV